MSNKREMVILGIQYLIVIVLAVFAVQTFWVGFNLMMHRVDVGEFGLDPTNAKLALYNSKSWYISWLSQMDNDFIRVPFGLLVLCSPYLFIKYVRKYNMSKRRRARK